MITPTARFHVTSKLIKRQMFGRAGLPLLRKRVLLTAAGHALIARNGVGLGPSQRADHGL
jgi:hypothetical protein